MLRICVGRKITVLWINGARGIRHPCAAEESGLLYLIVHKNQLNIDFEITRKTLKLLEKIVKILQGIGMGKKKFVWVGGITSQKHKADKGDFIKLKSFSIEKGIINRVKRYPIK